MRIKKFNEIEFYIFGSEDSSDWDVLVSVDKIPDRIEDAQQLCKYYNIELSKILPDKVINSNLGVIKNGILVDTFKGTVDELNNVIYWTWDKHNQYFPNPIKRLLERDINEKILRVARFILTFYSRTELRPRIKEALRGNLISKLHVLEDIDFKNQKLIGKNINTVDVYKIIAFQFGQVFSLIDGYESQSYTKSGIIKNYPDLRNFLLRQPGDLNILNKYMSRFINLIKNNLDNLRLTEL